jgi:Na+-transporting methylmalonyl-CoA/oxaloacetate decarboxylase beta subunit
VDLINKMTKNCTFAAKSGIDLIPICEPASVAKFWHKNEKKICMFQLQLRS